MSSLLILTFAGCAGAELNLALLVGELGGGLAEEDVEPALVRGIRHQDQDREEEEGQHRLPHLHQVLKLRQNMSKFKINFNSMMVAHQWGCEGLVLEVWWLSSGDVKA